MNDFEVNCFRPCVDDNGGGMTLAQWSMDAGDYWQWSKVVVTPRTMRFVWLSSDESRTNLSQLIVLEVGSPNMPIRTGDSASGISNPSPFLLKSLEAGYS